MKLCSIGIYIYLYVFCRILCEKTTNLGIWTPFWGSHEWRTTLVDGSLRWLNYFRYLSRFRSWGEMCTARLFSNGSTYLHSNFTWKGSSPINRSWHQKTRDTGLPDGEDGISLPSLVNTILECDGQTDGYVVANTALAKLALWCTIINCKCITTYLYKVCPWYDLNAVHFARYPLTMSNSALLFTLTVQCKTVLQDNQPWISLHFKLSIGRPIMSPAGNTKVS